MITLRVEADWASLQKRLGAQFSQRLPQAVSLRQIVGRAVAIHPQSEGVEREGKKF